MLKLVKSVRQLKKTCITSKQAQVRYENLGIRVFRHWVFWVLVFRDIEYFGFGYYVTLGILSIGN